MHKACHWAAIATNRRKWAEAQVKAVRPLCSWVFFRIVVLSITCWKKGYAADFAGLLPTWKAYLLLHTFSDCFLHAMSLICTANSGLWTMQKMQRCFAHPVLTFLQAISTLSSKVLFTRQTSAGLCLDHSFVSTRTLQLCYRRYPFASCAASGWSEAPALAALPP